MPGVVNVGKNVMDVRQSVALRPYSKVVITVDENTEFVSGDDSGETLEIECPWGSQAIADNIYSLIRGVRYQPYTATTAVVEPSAEMGDAVQANSVYGGMYQQDSIFGSSYYSDFSAPSDEQLNHEYTYASPTERKITRQAAWTKAQFTIANDAISAEVNERTAQGESLQGQINAHSDEISAKVSQTGGASSSFGWSLISTAFTLSSGSKAVFTCDKDGIAVDGTITAREGYIGNGTKGFKINNTAIYNPSTKSTLSSDTVDGVYVGTDGIALGKGKFMVKKTGELTATSATITGKITATSGFIGTETSGFKIGSTNIQNGMTNLGDKKNEGVYVGTDGIALGKGNFIVDKKGNVTANNITVKGYLGGTSGFKVEAKKIYNGVTSLIDTKHTGVYIGTDGIVLGTGQFIVTSGGSLTAKSGYIGNGTSGFTIGTKSIYNGKSSIGAKSADQTEGVYLGTNGIAIGRYANTSGSTTTYSDGFSVTSAGVFTARKGYIGNGTSGFEIGNKYLRNGMKSIGDTGNDGVYIGTDGIALGKGKFKVDSKGNLTATSGTFDGTIYANRLSFKTSSGTTTTISGSNLTDGTVGTSQISSGGVESGNIKDGAVSKPKTSSGVKSSLDNGDSAKDKIDDLMAGRITATTLITKILWVYDGSTSRRANWQSATIDGTTIKYLGY